jgi:predicted phosphodiesterase
MRLAILSDIHEDYVSLYKALEDILLLEVNKIVFLGDIVGFDTNYKYKGTKSARKCVQLIQKHGQIVVSGNHDLHAVGKLPYLWKDIGFPENWYAISMEEKVHNYEKHFFIYKNELENDLSENEKRYLNTIDHYKLLEVEDSKLLFSHFIYPDVNGNKTLFLNRREGFREHFSWMQELGASISFAGHAHFQGVGIVKNKGVKFGKFGEYKLKNEPQIILCPSIAKGKNKNGYIIYDTNEMNLTAIGL